MKLSFLSLTTALLLAMTLVTPIAASEQRPYRASFDGSAIPVEQRCGPNALTIGFAVSGVATHMGRFSGIGTNCTEPTLTTHAVAIWDGIIVLEVADGSTLTMSSMGSQDAPVAGVAAATQMLTVVSGSGRFSNAAGELVLTGVVDFGDFTTSGTVLGWLRY